MHANDRRLDRLYRIASVAFLIAAPAAPAAEETGGSTMALVLQSDAFDTGATIPRVHTCDGEDVSPALAWSGAPAGTRSYTLIMDDPNAPPGTWVHWVLYDLPADTTGLDRGLPKTERVASGGVQGACWGVDTFARVGYHGPCPPPGKPHRYVFKLYALDAALGLDPRATKVAVERAMRGHVLAEAKLIGIYGR
jgi:hypothetical protein